MQNPLFKLTALAGVIGAGVLIVIEAQQHLTTGGGAEQFHQLAAAATEPGVQTDAAPDAKSPVPTPGAHPFAELKTSTPPDVVVRGPSDIAASTTADSPAPPAFLFTPNTPPAADQTEPTPTASAASPPDGNSEPTSAESGPIQLVAGEFTAAEAEVNGGLTPLPAEVGAPTLLTPPTPPRPEDEQSPADTGRQPEALQAGYESSSNANAATLLATATADLTSNVNDSATPDQFVQADPFPAAADRTRTPAPTPTAGDIPDLFGQLPGAETPQPAGTTNDLLLPPTPNGSTPADAGDPFTPAPIQGTAPGEPDFLPEAAPVQPERTRTPLTTEAPAAAPALFPTELAPTPSAAETAAPTPDLFLPQEPAPAAEPLPAATAPRFPPASDSGDPFAAAPSPTPAPTAAAQPRSRTRDVPGDPPATESPFFESQPTPANGPTRTAQPGPAADPFPVFPAANPEPALVLPSPAGPTAPATFTQPANPIPSFPNPTELGASTPSPLPTAAPARSSIPTTPAFPDRSSIPASTTPQATVTPTPAPTQPNLDPFPSPNSLSGTGTFDSTAPAGLQPELQIEKIAPPRAVLNQELIYTIRVRNMGRSAAHQVVVEDSIPRGSRLDGTNPIADQDPISKHLVWRFETLQPGEERLIRVKVIPTEPGELGSVATVRFVGRIAARTTITAPRIKLELTGPAETAVGDAPIYRLRVSNLGDGDAANVVIKSAIPNLFQHPSGSELEYNVGALRAGQTRDLELALSAVKPGQAAQTFQALVDEREQDRTTADVVVLASRLSIERTGPEKRFVNRPANYVTQVINQSSEALRNVTVVEQLPPGVELAAVPQHGRFDPTRRTITWSLPELGPQQTHEFTSSLVTADEGTYPTTVHVWDAAGNKAEASSQLLVAGFSSLKTEFAQTTQGGGEVAVGEQVALRMTVANRGSAAASDVVTEFEIPPELEFVAAKPAQFELQDRKIRFAPIPHMDINGQQVIEIVCVARQPGTPRIAASIWSKEQTAIRQEEAVVVFRETP